MAERAQHNDPKDKSKFGQGKKDLKSTQKRTPKDTAKIREAKRSKGGRESGR